MSSKTIRDFAATVLKPACRMLAHRAAKRRHVLMALDAHTLKDIGIDRSMITLA